MRTRIKVCGIASVDEARLAVEAGADALGFNCLGQVSPRAVAESTVAEITKVTPPAVATFLLTLEQTADAIVAHIRHTGPTTVQILSPIDPAESARLARLEPHLRRVQVIHVEGRAVLEMIPVYSPYVHAFLLDSGRPNAATPELGGTGRQHDWTISAEFIEASQLPVFLAGGLTPANVGERNISRTDMSNCGPASQEIAGQQSSVPALIERTPGRLAMPFCITTKQSSRQPAAGAAGWRSGQ